MSRTSSDGTELIFTVVLTLTRGLVYSSSRRRSSSLFGHIIFFSISGGGKNNFNQKLKVVHYCDIQKLQREKISFFIHCTASASSKIPHSQFWPLTQDQNRLHTGDTSLKQINFIPRGEMELAQLSALPVLRIPHSVLLYRREWQVNMWSEEYFYSSLSWWWIQKIKG